MTVTEKVALVLYKTVEFAGDVVFMNPPVEFAICITFPLVVRFEIKVVPNIVRLLVVEKLPEPVTTIFALDDCVMQPPEITVRLPVVMAPR